MAATLDDIEIIDPDYYVDHGYPHEAWELLRREAPLFWFDRSDVPFWAVTHYRDIVAVSRQPRTFANGPRFQLAPGSEGPAAPTIISMDPPEHGLYRELVSRRFTPRALLPVVAVLRWLRPHLPADMRIPVYAYITVISTMVVFAVATWAHNPGLSGERASAVIVAGALLFYLSDLAVARDRFVAPSFWNRAWGLPFYYGGQIVLALTV